MEIRRQLIVGGDQELSIKTPVDTAVDALLRPNMSECNDWTFALNKFDADPEKYFVRAAMMGLLGRVRTNQSRYAEPIAVAWSNRMLTMAEGASEEEVPQMDTLLDYTQAGLKDVTRRNELHPKLRMAARRANFELKLGRVETAQELGLLLVDCVNDKFYREANDLLYEAILEHELPVDIYDESPQLLSNAAKALSKMKVRGVNTETVERNTMRAVVLQPHMRHARIIKLAHGIVSYGEQDSTEIEDDTMTYQRACEIAAYFMIRGVELRDAIDLPKIEQVGRMITVLLHTAQPPAVVK